MSASRKLRWKKLVNQLRYMYEELDIVDEISSAGASEFQEYYEDFCRRRDVDIGELNRKHAERVQKLYGRDQEKESDMGAVPYSGSTDLVPYEETEEGRAEEEGGSPILEGCDQREMYEIFSKLFKRLALKLHPDKLSTALTQDEKDDMLKMFTKAKAALEENRYFILIDYAEKLKIPLPKNYRQQIRWMKKEQEIVRQKIGKQMRSYNYMFAETESDEDKDNLIKQFIQQLFGETIE